MSFASRSPLVASSFAPSLVSRATPSVSRVEARGPRENRVAVKAAELQEPLRRPNPSFANARTRGAERVPVFVSSAGNVFPFFRADAEVVEIDSSARDAASQPIT